MEYPWHLILMAVLYIIAGANHFRVPETYYKIIPDFLVYKDFLNFMAGILEILFGISLLIPIYTSVAASSIIILLIAVFPSNIYMVVNPKARLGLPLWLLILRLPLQFLLIWWASLYM